MDQLFIWLIKKINGLIPTNRILIDLHEAKLSTSSYQSWEYHEAQKVCPEFDSYWDLENKTVLDIGSGLGGKLIYYAEKSAKSITGIDIRTASCMESRQLAIRKNLDKIVVVNGDAGALPFKKNYFDLIVSINVFEHLNDIVSTLKECKRVLRPKGLLFLHFPPFYSPWGAHLEGWINFPWPHLLFSEKNLISALRDIENTQGRNIDYIQSAGFNWEGLDHLPELNHLTYNQFRKHVKAANLKIISVRLLPIGRHYFLKWGMLGKGMISFLKKLVLLPLFKEILTTKMVFVLSKDGE